MGLRFYTHSKFEARGVRKITIGITGLWRPSVHSDVAFLSFDARPSYHCEAEFKKRLIVQPLTGSVRWVYTVVRQVSFTLLTSSGPLGPLYHNRIYNSVREELFYQTSGAIVGMI